MLMTIANQIPTVPVWESTYLLPRSERFYSIAFYVAPSGNYTVRIMPSGEPFVVLPRVFERVTGVYGDHGTLDINYSQLAAIGGVSV